MRLVRSRSAGRGGVSKTGLFWGILVSVVLFAGAAQAQTPEIEGKKAQAQQVQLQMQQTLQEVAEAQARYNASQEKLAEVTAEIRANERKLQRTERELWKARSRLDARAEGSYKSAGMMYLDVLFSVRSFGEFATKGALLRQIMEDDRETLSNVREAKARLAGQRERLTEQRARQAEISRQMQEEQAAIDWRLQEQRAYYEALDAEIKDLVQEERARQVREAAARRAEQEAQRRAREEAERLAAAAAEEAQREAELAAEEAARSAAEQQYAGAAAEQYEDPSAAEAQYEEEQPVVAADGRAQAILDNPNISMSSQVQQDLANGIVDSRVLDVVEFAATDHTIAISVFATGHPYGPTLDALGYTGYPNAHYFGRAVDIYMVDGVAVTAGNAAAQELAAAIYDTFTPPELGSPWPFGPGSFVDALHQDHIHVGWPYAANGGL